jgi:hypothetical protein
LQLRGCRAIDLPTLGGIAQLESGDIFVVAAALEPGVQNSAPALNNGATAKRRELRIVKDPHQSVVFPRQQRGGLVAQLEWGDISARARPCCVR